MSSLFARLKSGTEQQHRELEALVDPIKNLASRADDEDYPARSWSFYCDGLDRKNRPLGNFAPPWWER